MRRIAAMFERTTEPARAADSSRVESAGRPRRVRRPSQVFRKAAGEPDRPAKVRDCALIACFLIAIPLPLVGRVLSLDSGFVLDENRTLSSRPELKRNVKDLAEYPAKFEAYFNDQFGFRKRLIHWLNFTKVAALGVSPSPKVIFGRNGWLFYGDVDIPYYRAVTPLSPAQLAAWLKRLEERQEWLADRGIPYLIVFTPLKGTIYPEYLPVVYNRIGTASRLDQLMRHLKAHSKLTIIDLREALLDEKSRHQVYYRTDTHWNTRGSYVGYTQIMRVLCGWFPELEPIPISAFEEAHCSEQGRDLALLLGMRPYFWDNYDDLRMIKPRLGHDVQTAPPTSKVWMSGPDIVYENPNRGLPKAVMFRDSFASWLIPLLSENFSRITYSWQYTFEYETVERERPDVVIQEMVERALMDHSAPSR
jgi:alginate O-acetyltransferase complex protein AlgJ